MEQMLQEAIKKSQQETREPKLNPWLSELLKSMKPTPQHSSAFALKCR